MIKPVRLYAVLSVMLLVAGCASPGRQILARRGSISPPEGTRRVAFMPQPFLSPEEKVLRRDLAAALSEKGFEVSEATNADLTLTCQIEQSWRTTIRTVSQPYFAPSPPFILGPPGAPLIMEQNHWQPPFPEQVEERVGLKGIRLQFYDSASLRARRFELAWDGYIEAGMKLRPEQQPVLIRALLDHYGQNFSGRKKIEE